MNKKILLLSMCLMCGATAFAQTKDKAAVEAEMQQQLTDLKMSRQIIYADSYEGKKIYEQAKLRQRNQKKLEYMIHQFLVKDLGLSTQDAQELYDFVDDKLQNVERTIDGATVAHMFSWITKESLVSLVKKNNYDFKPIAEFIEHPERYELDEKLQAKIDGLKYNANFLEETQDETLADVSEVVETQAEPTPAPVVEKPAPAPVVVEPAPAPAMPERSALINELYNAANFRTVTILLNQKKNAGTIEWGNQQAMAGKTDKCIVVVLDRQTREIVTILGTGTTSRFDYTNKTTCSDEQFANYSRIYVQEL